MALRYAERVKETTTNKPATSATAFDLGGPRTGFRGFVPGIGTGNRCVYCAQKIDTNGNPGGAWEIAVGTVVDASPDTLSREYLIASSTGSFIDWSATGENASPDVFIVHHAALAPANASSPVLADGSRWFTPLLPNLSPQQGFASASVTWFMFLDVSQPCLIRALRINVGTAVASNNARLMAYDDRAGLPYGRLMEGTVSIASAGIQTYTPGSPVFFAGGRLWTACQSQSGSAQFMGITGSGGVSGGVGATYGVATGSFTTATNGLRCTTQGYADGSLDPWAEALSQNDNAGHQPYVQVQLEYL